MNLTNDLLQTLLVAVGPAAIALALAVFAIARLTTQTQQRTLLSVSLALILLQIAVIIAACYIFGTGIKWDPFTMFGAIGLVYCSTLIAVIFRSTSKPPDAVQHRQCAQNFPE